MKRILEITSVVFVALALVFGASGLSMHKMSCLESGKVLVSLQQVICCPDDFVPVEETSFVPTCCEFDFASFKVHSFQSKERAFEWVAPPVVATLLPRMVLNVHTPEYREVVCTPPLHPGERRALLCTYLI